MEEEKLIDILKKETEQKADRRMSTPMDFDFLSLKIKETIGDTVSPSTIKRLWGYVSSSHTPNESTLSIFARFIGYRDWKEFQSLQKDNVSSSFLECEQIQTSQLKEGDMLELKWKPNRYCRIVYLGNFCFRILEVKNSKLQPQATFRATLFCVGQPLFLSGLSLDGEEGQTYVVGKCEGLSYVICMK